MNKNNKIKKWRINILTFKKLRMRSKRRSMNCVRISRLRLRTMSSPLSVSQSYFFIKRKGINQIVCYCELCQRNARCIRQSWTSFGKFKRSWECRKPTVWRCQIDKKLFRPGFQAKFNCESVSLEREVWS